MKYQISTIRGSILSISLLLAPITFLQADSATSVQQELHAPEITVAKQFATHLDTTALDDLKVQALRHFDITATILETMGQGLASGASKTPANRKPEIQKTLTNLRTGVSQISSFAAGNHVDEAQLQQLIMFNAELLTILDKAIQSNLSDIPDFDLDAVARRILANGTASTESLRSALASNEKQLAKLIKSAEQIGLSTLNLAYRSTRKFCKDYSVLPVIEHVAVYSAMYFWLLYVTSDTKINLLPTNENSSWWLGRKLHSFKEWSRGIKKGYVGGTPMESTNTLEIPANIAVATDNEGVAMIVGKYNPQLQTFMKNFDSETGKPVLMDISDKIESGKIQLAATPVEEFNVIPSGKITVASQSKTNDHSLPNRTLDILAPFVNVDFKKAMFEFTPAAFFAGYITKDAITIGKKIDRFSKEADDILFGTTKRVSYEDTTIRTETFDDIVGAEDVKEWLSRVVQYICHPDRFDRAGINIERGILFAGEPRNGKSLCAKALANEISLALERSGNPQKVRLFEVKMDELLVHGVEEYMKAAKKHAPCILFFDELDLLRLQRDGDTKMLSAFLTGMSGSLTNNEKDQVIILAATNKPENLDFALRQHGRFGKIFFLDKPTYKHRVEFFEKQCEKRCLNPGSFNFDAIAQETEGCSFGTLDTVMKDALMNAKLQSVPVDQEHFIQSMNLNVKRLVPHGYMVPAEKELIVAVRQAGKALTTMLLKPAKQFCSVTVLPIVQELEETHVQQQYSFGDMPKKEQRSVVMGGVFAYHLLDTLGIEPQAELEKECKILLASNVAQKAFGLESCAFDKADKQEAFKVAKQIVFEGLDPKDCAKSIREEKLVQAFRLIERFEKEIEKLLTAHKSELETIVAELQKRKTLTVGEIRESLKWDTASAA